MKYSDYNEVEISFRRKRRNGNPDSDLYYWDRGYIESLSDVKQYLGKTNVFISSARFKSLGMHQNKNKNAGHTYQGGKLGVMAGFDGSLYYDFVIIDLDNTTTKQVLLFLNHLDINYDIPKDILRMYFSGSKGFHILIPSTIFGLKPSLTLNVQVREIVKELCANVITFDSTLYDKLQAYRLRNTLHSSSGLYKIPIGLRDLVAGMDHIRKTAQRNVQKYDYPEYPTDANPDLEELANSFIPNDRPTTKGKNSEPQENTYPPFRKLCIYKMLEGVTKSDDDGSPGRVETGIRLAVHFKKENFGRQYTEVIMDTWNSNNLPPLKEAIVRELVRSAYNAQYDYGCNDPIHKYYCKTNCFLYRGSGNV